MAINHWYQVGHSSYSFEGTWAQFPEQVQDCRSLTNSTWLKMSFFRLSVAIVTGIDYLSQACRVIAYR